MTEEEEKNLTVAQKILNKTANILVVHPNGAERSLFSACFKDVGFKNVNNVADIKKAIGYLENENVDWIAAAISKESETTIFQLLKLANTAPELMQTMITPILTESEMNFVPSLAELGGFVNLIGTPTRDALKAKIQQTIEFLDDSDGDLLKTLVAHLDLFYREQFKFDELSNLYESLIGMYPGDVNMLLKVAESQLINDRKEDGNQTLLQIQMLSSEYEDPVKKLLDKYLDGEFLEVASEEETGTNALNLRSILLAGLDDDSTAVLEESLPSIGVPFDSCKGGEDATEWVEEHEELDLIIMDWRFPDLAGSAFIQRVRACGCHVPVLILYYEIDDGDRALLKESGLVLELKKPFNREQLLKKLVWLRQQDTKPVESTVLISKIKEALSVFDEETAQGHFEELQKLDNVGEGEMSLIKGEFDYAAEDYDNAHKKAVIALNAEADPVGSLNLMGRALMKLGQFKVAFEAFDNAQLLSPLNLKRLCYMAEAKVESGEIDEAADIMDEAVAMDSSNSDVAETKFFTSVASGEGNEAKEVMARMGNISNVISFLNNKAVSKSMVGDIEGGLKLYTEALQSIPDEHGNYRTVINYNLGLAHLRAGDMMKAKAAMEKCSIHENIDITDKARTILDTIEDALANKKKLKVAPAKQKKSDGTNLKQMRRAIARLGTESPIRPGERCLYLVYKAKETPKLVNKSLQRPVTFKPKKAHHEGGRKTWV